MTLHTWTTDIDTGMTTIILTSRAALKAAIIGSVRASHQPKAAIALEHAEFESEAWEVVYEEWREGEMNGSNYYAYDEHELPAPLADLVQLARDIDDENGRHFHIDVSLANRLTEILMALK